MKVVYLQRKNLKFVILGVICLVVAIAILGLYSRHEAPTMVEPIYQGNAQSAKVAIAINVDWGEDVVPAMLKVLKEKEVKVTFFVTGRFAEKFPDMVRAMAADGHEIGNHGYAHPHPDQLSVAENVADIVKAEKILMPIIGHKPMFFAPPYGEHGANCVQAAADNDYRTVLWTADTVDWQVPPPSVETLVARVTGDKLHNGSIILMHPKAHTLQALPVIIETIQAKGLALSGLSEVL